MKRRFESNILTKRSIMKNQMIKILRCDIYEMIYDNTDNNSLLQVCIKL